MNAFEPKTASPRCVLGLDVGGTKTAGGVIHADGRIAFHDIISTSPRRGPDPVANDVYRLAERLIERANSAAIQPAAIGISLCELVDNTGNIVSGETIRWRTGTIVSQFRRLAPTVIEADCRAAAVAEARHGAGQGIATFLYITIGTGISCSLVNDGRAYLGAHGLTGTMASGPLTLPCGTCGNQAAVVLEQFASGPAIARRFNELTRSHVEGAEGVIAAAESGDVAARHVLVTAATAVGSVLGLLVGVLDPHALIIGGGLGSAAGVYWESLQSAIRAHIWSNHQRQLPIAQGKLGPMAGLIGAGLAALDRFPQEPA